GVVIDFGLLDLDLVGREVGQLDLGAHVLLDGEAEIALLRAVQAGDLADLDLGAADGLELRLGGGLLVEIGQGVVDGLLHDRGAAEALLDELGGDLALAEARDLHLVGDLLGGGLDGRLELVEGHLDGELHPGRAELLGLGLHWSGLPVDGHRMDDSRGAPGARTPATRCGVGVTGFEPATSRSQSRGSTMLSYTAEGNPAQLTWSSYAVAERRRGLWADACTRRACRWATTALIGSNGTATRARLNATASVLQTDAACSIPAVRSDCSTPPRRSGCRGFVRSVPLSAAPPSTARPRAALA